MSVATRAFLTPERIKDGRRVWTHCRYCKVEVPLDSPDRTWDEDEEDFVALNAPNAMALKIAATLIVCDDCEIQFQRRDEAIRERSQFAALVDGALLPAALKGLDFRDMDRAGNRRGAVAAARKWALEGGGLMLTGPVGVGKTRLAATAVWAAMGANRPMRWMSVPVLIAQSLAGFNETARKQATATLTGATGLVLDDLGKEKPSEWTQQLVFAAVDRRIQAGAPLLITSNLDADELAARMGDWLGSRIAGYCEQVVLDGPDRRLA